MRQFAYTPMLLRVFLGPSENPFVSAIQVLFIIWQKHSLFILFQLFIKVILSMSNDLTVESLTDSLRNVGCDIGNSPMFQLSHPGHIEGHVSMQKNLQCRTKNAVT